MLLKVLSTLLFVSSLVSADEIFACNGTELSVSSDQEVGLLTEKPCTHVYGDIVIQNLNNAKRMPSYWTVKQLHGSLIIINTTRLEDSVNFQNLRMILARNQPAIILKNNRKLKLAIGASLGVVNTQHNITYYVVDNWPAMMTESLHYTLYRAAHVDRPVFYTDNFFITHGCGEITYKVWTFVFGTLCTIVSFMLLFVSFRGRPEEKTVKIN